MSIHRITVPVVTALATLVFACSANVGMDGSQGDARKESTATVSQNLYGGISTDGCGGYDPMIRAAMNVGRFVASTREYRMCIEKQYRRCAGDDYPFSEPAAVEIASVKGNDTAIVCKALPGAAIGSTRAGIPDDWSGAADVFSLGLTDLLGLDSDEHTSTYGGTEHFALDTDTFLASMKRQYDAGSYAPLFQTASVIWHEAMHVYGFQHGDNGDPVKAKTACGRDGDPTWDWRANSGPYAAEGCMDGAWVKRGDFGGDPPSWADAGASIVDAYFERHHTRLGASQRAAIFAGIAAGTYTADQLESDARRNSDQGGATTLRFDTPVRDELIDAGGFRWYRFDVPEQMQVRVTVQAMPDDATTSSPGAFGAAPTDVMVIGVLASQGYGAQVSREMLTGRNTTTWALGAGGWYVRVDSATGLVQYTVTVEEVAPPAPDGWSAIVECGQYVNFTCNPTWHAPYVQHLDAHGVWQGKDPMSALVYTDASGHVLPSYRICVDWATRPQASCSGVIDFWSIPGECTGTADPGTGSHGGKGKCKGKTCMTG